MKVVCLPCILIKNSVKKRKMNKDLNYYLFHPDFKIKEIFPARLANLKKQAFAIALICTGFATLRKLFTQSALKFLSHLLPYSFSICILQDGAGKFHHVL